MIQNLQNFLIDYPIIAPAIFIFIRILPVVIPPIPGLVIDAVGVIVFGWFWGFVYAVTAVVTASMISFNIGRRYREPLIGKFISIKKVHEWEDKLSEKEKFWTLVSLRFVSSPFFDIINYVAGLTKIKASTYFLSSIVVTTPMAFMIYYFGHIILNAPVIIISSLILVVPIAIWYKKKNGRMPDVV